MFFCVLCSNRQRWPHYYQLRLHCSMSRLRCCPAPYSNHLLGCHLMVYRRTGFPHEIHSFRRIPYQECLPRECQTRDSHLDYQCPDRACCRYLGRECHHRDSHRDYLARDSSRTVCRDQAFHQVHRCHQCQACHRQLAVKVGFYELIILLQSNFCCCL